MNKGGLVSNPIIVPSPDANASPVDAIRGEVIALLERAPRVGVGTIFQVVEEALGSGFALEVSRVLSSLRREGHIQIDTYPVRESSRAPLVGYVSLISPRNANLSN